MINIKKLSRKAAKVMLILLASFFIFLLIILGILLYQSPGKPEPITDNNGNILKDSISEKIFVDINGIKQGMFIRSSNLSNPVLLFVHGGPAMPEYFLEQNFPTGLDKYFTVCWWEQRGAGLSYSSNIPPETMTVGQMISDISEVTKYLQKRFGKEKIYLMGHSWGSFIALQAAARTPEQYFAYIGVGQISNQKKSEELAYDFMLEKYKQTGNEKMFRKLKDAAPIIINNNLADSYIAVRDESMHSLGIGTTHTMKSVVSGIFIPVMICKAYTLSEKINLWRGKWSPPSIKLWNQLLSTNLNETYTDFKIPVYILHGKYDYTCSYSEAKNYFDSIKAPIKGFYTFSNSAHSPLFEEPEKFLEILQKDILKGTNNLADK